jgi:hypothetical protein
MTTDPEKSTSLAGDKKAEPGASWTPDEKQVIPKNRLLPVR